MLERMSDPGDAAKRLVDRSCASAALGVQESQTELTEPAIVICGLQRHPMFFMTKYWTAMHLPGIILLARFG
jgi:hypothetical protein